MTLSNALSDLSATRCLTLLALLIILYHGAGQEAVLDQPGNPDPLVEAAHSAYKNEEYAQAVAYLRERLQGGDLSDERQAQLWMLAGHAGLRSSDPDQVDQAITAFGKAGELSDQWRDPALYYQGNAKVLLNRPKAALAIYDALLERELKPPYPLRVRMARGVALLLMGQSEPTHLQEAARMFSSIADDDQAPLPMRLEALARKTKAHVDARQQEAVVACAKRAWDLSQAHDGQSSVWAQRALHEAATNEAAGQRWQSAVDLLEAAAKLPGPLAADSERQAEAWRLRHFLWED